MAIYINPNHKIKNIFINVNGEIKSVSSAWVSRNGIPIKVFGPNHKHIWEENVTKQPTCTEDGEKTYICNCGNSYTEVIPATGHDFVDGTCTNCGEKDPDIVNKIKIGDTETRVIAGQKLEFICIDDNYIDASGEVKGALFIAKSFISGSVLSMGASNQNDFVKDWALNAVRSKLNGSTSDLTNLISVDTTVMKTYSENKTTTNYDMETINSYGVASGYNTMSTKDRVFILSLEEAIKYNKVIINDKEISAMWDLNCDGTIEFISGSTGKYGYYLRTPAADTTKAAFGVAWNGQVATGYTTNWGIRPCYVKNDELVHEHIYNEDGVCTVCGHKHIWEENVDSISWIKNTTQSTSLGQNGNVWTLHYNTSNKYTTFTSHGTWDIEIPMDTEYSFDYYSGFINTNDIVRVFLDDKLIVEFSNSSKSGSETISLTSGKHTLQMYLYKQNTTTSATYATITLNSVEVLNHICNECGEKEAHHYTEKVTKEPTCTEKGEKELTCTKCGHSHTEEIEATGHTYVDNTVGNNSNHKCTVCGDEEGHSYGDDLKCTVCGHFRGDYTLVFNSESKVGNIAGDAEYEQDKAYLSDGDKIILPNASSSCYELDGWYYVKEVSQPYMYNMGLSHVWNGTYDRSYNCWANPDLRLYAYGNGVDVIQPSTGIEWTTNYHWQNTATTDVFTINTPTVYEFQITETQHIYPITLNQHGSYSLQYLLKDISKDESYDLRDIVLSYDTLYDYGNIKIKCSKVDNVKKNDTTKWYDGTITYYYTVYFEPGEYQITLSGRIGNSTADPNKSSIVVDMYGSQSSFYELHSLNDGEIFDASEMYTVEGDKTIYLVPNWRYKLHYDNERITEATCTSNGTRYRSCSICKYSSTETIPMLGHNYQEEVITAVTCTTPGESTYTCANCNDTYTETKPALGHDLDEDSICKRCGKKVTAGLYNEDGIRIATWEELVNDYRMDITTAYTGSTCKTSETSPYYIFTNNEELSSGTKLVIDDTIDKISNYSFAYCSNLQKIEIPDSIVSLGTGAFANCTELLEVRIPDNVKSIGDSVFAGCTSVVNIDLGEGITKIPAYAFSNCSSLTEMELPDSVIWMMNGAFNYCTNLKSLYMPASVTTISYTNTTWTKPSYSSFSNCSALTVYCGAASRPTGWMSYWNAISYTASIDPKTYVTTYSNIKYVPTKWNISRNVYRESYK